MKVVDPLRNKEIVRNIVNVCSYTNVRSYMKQTVAVSVGTAATGHTETVTSFYSNLKHIEQYLQYYGPSYSNLVNRACMVLICLSCSLCEIRENRAVSSEK